MAVVSMRELLECGVHFGHPTKRCHPKMKSYIFTARNDIHVIDLQKTLKIIEKTYQILKEKVEKGATVLFVGTKKQAQEAVKTEALRCGMYFVNQRWLGGLLTNFITLQRSIQKLKKLEKMKESGVFDKLSKKERSKKEKMLFKLSNLLEGIKTMNRLPEAIFVVDTQKEHLAVKEAQKLGIPIFGVIDTNADPTEVQYPIPANDDAIRAVKLICSIIANAVIEGKKGKLPSTSTEETEIVETIAEEIKEDNIDFTEEVLGELEIFEDFEIDDEELVKDKLKVKKMTKDEEVK